MIYREALGEEAARGMGGDDGCFKVQGVHECSEIRRKIIEAVPLRWVAGIPVARCVRAKARVDAGR